MITATANTRVVDLCCGIGGLSVAAREMGMQVVAGAGRQVFGCR
jgi:site-specific DNA-cytosine methylase